MTESDAEFKAKFMELVNTMKAEAGKTSSLMLVEKRERIIRCLQHPELEHNVKFRARVKERKYRLLQDGDQLFLGVPDETSGELIYRRAACVEEFWDIIHAAHVDNGHIGVVHTFNSIRGMYALLPRHLVSKYVRMCPVCSHTFRRSCKIVMNASVSNPATPIPITSSAPLVEGIESVVTAAAAAAAGGQVKSDGDGGGGSGGAGGGEGEVMTMTSETEGGGEHLSIGEELAVNPVVEVPIDSASPPVAAMVAGTVATPAPTMRRIQVLFNCHICGLSFNKRLFFQRHLRAHREHTPRIPFVSPYKSLLHKPPPPQEKRRVKQERRTFTTVPRGRYVIIDGDMGVEACQGLMLAAWRSDLVIVGVTCIGGAVSTERACHNALLVLSTCGREDVPVFCGAERPLIAKKTSSSDSLPGLSWQTGVDDTQIKPEHAVSAMIRLVGEQPGKISVVCLGPLTNLALALRLDPTLGRKVKEVIVIGGNIEGRGDSSVCAEQNFHYDPEAAYAVLEDLPNITLLPYEVCDRHKLPGDFFDSWVQLGTTRSEFVRGMGDEPWLKEKQEKGYAPFCAYAIAYVSDRTVALEKKTVYATVELSGAFSRGMMVVDWARKLGNEPNVEVIKSLDLGKIQSLLIGMVEDPEAMEVYTVG